MGNRSTTTYGNTTSTEYAYSTTDPRYLLNTITHKLGSTTLATMGYTATARDNAGNPKSMTDWAGTWGYNYDANNRLIGATPPAPVPDQPAGGDYGYDWVGNRLNPPTGSNHMVYNKADQLTGWPGMHTYTYYGDGSLHEAKDTSGANTLRHYEYTPNGLLEEATYNSRTLTNTWDASKNRVSFTAGGNTHTFVYDKTARIPAVVQEDGMYYVREPGGSLIARLDGGDSHYYHFDALGSTRLLTDSNGNITDRYTYDAYGSLISRDEFTDSVDQPYQYIGQLGYYTHWQEPEFGLLQLGVRFYDSETGMFTQRDRIESRMSSSYVYGYGIPTTLTDASGRLPYNPIKPVSRLKVCRRPIQTGQGVVGDMTACAMGAAWMEHTYLLIDGVPFGYGPGGATDIPADWDDLHGSPNCSEVDVTDPQFSCIKKLADNPSLIPGGPWNPRGSKSGGYNFCNHNCLMFTDALLSACKVNGWN